MGTIENETSSQGSDPERERTSDRDEQGSRQQPRRNLQGNWRLK